MLVKPNLVRSRRLIDPTLHMDSFSFKARHHGDLLLIDGSEITSHSTRDLKQLKLPAVVTYFDVFPLDTSMVKAKHAASVGELLDMVALLGPVHVDVRHLAIVTEGMQHHMDVASPISTPVTDEFYPKIGVF